MGVFKTFNNSAGRLGNIKKSNSFFAKMQARPFGPASEFGLDGTFPIFFSVSLKLTDFINYTWYIFFLPWLITHKHGQFLVCSNMHLLQSSMEWTFRIDLSTVAVVWLWMCRSPDNHNFFLCVWLLLIIIGSHAFKNRIKWNTFPLNSTERLIISLRKVGCKVPNSGKIEDIEALFHIYTWRGYDALCLIKGEMCFILINFKHDSC